MQIIDFFGVKKVELRKNCCIFAFLIVKNDKNIIL